MTDPTSPEFQSSNALAGPAGSSELVFQTLRSLRQTLQYVLVLLILLSGSLFVYLLREVSTVRRQNTELTRVVSEYQRIGGPTLEEFRKKLVDYAHAHPDFGPILGKYFTATNPPPQNGPVLLPTSQ